MNGTCIYLDATKVYINCMHEHVYPSCNTLNWTTDLSCFRQNVY